MAPAPHTSCVSVAYSKLGPSTMASTGQASWQNPAYSKKIRLGAAARLLACCAAALLALHVKTPKHVADWGPHACAEHRANTLGHPRHGCAPSTSCPHTLRSICTSRDPKIWVLGRGGEAWGRGEGSGVTGGLCAAACTRPSAHFAMHARKLRRRPPARQPVHPGHSPGRSC